MNRRSFFRSLLAAGCVAAARVWVPSSLRVATVPLPEIEVAPMTFNGVPITFDSLNESIWLLAWGENAVESMSCIVPRSNRWDRRQRRLLVSRSSIRS